jgi:hypothetical protein
MPFLRSIIFSIVFLSASLLAQTTPEISVNGVKLGDRASAKALLENFALAADGSGGFAYFFYNDFGDKVWKLTAASFEDRFMIVEIEVFLAPKSYGKPHFYLKDVDQFVTESKIFVGKKVSATAAFLGEGLATDMRIGPKDLTRKKGEPTKREADGNKETFVYSVKGLEIADEKGAMLKFDYTGRYEFNDKRLKRFVISIKPAATGN